MCSASKTPTLPVSGDDENIIDLAHTELKSNPSLPDCAKSKSMCRSRLINSVLPKSVLCVPLERWQIFGRKKTMRLLKKLRSRDSAL